jgi:hypothetical protein|tara:strand:+ start:765 stop:1016 length:252 start_codon:yes stop_codon:yes gene_type:complete
MKLLNQFFSGFGKGSKMFGHNISVIINSVLLSLVYLIGVGLTSIIAKLFNKKFLDMRISKKKESYWTELSLKKRPIEEFYRQF